MTSGYQDYYQYGHDYQYGEYPYSTTGVTPSALTSQTAAAAPPAVGPPPVVASTPVAAQPSTPQTAVPPAAATYDQSGYQQYDQNYQYPQTSTEYGSWQPPPQDYSQYPPGDTTSTSQYIAPAAAQYGQETGGYAATATQYGQSAVAAPAYSQGSPAVGYETPSAAPTPYSQAPYSQAASAPQYGQATTAQYTPVDTPQYGQTTPSQYAPVDTAQYAPSTAPYGQDPQYSQSSTTPQYAAAAPYTQKSTYDPTSGQYGQDPTPYQPTTGQYTPYSNGQTLTTPPVAGQYSQPPVGQYSAPTAAGQYSQPPVGQFGQTSTTAPYGSSNQANSAVPPAAPQYSQNTEYTPSASQYTQPASSYGQDGQYTPGTGQFGPSSVPATDYKSGYSQETYDVDSTSSRYGPSTQPSGQYGGQQSYGQVQPVSSKDRSYSSNRSDFQSGQSSSSYRPSSSRTFSSSQSQDDTRRDNFSSRGFGSYNRSPRGFRGGQRGGSSTPAFRQSSPSISSDKFSSARTDRESNDRSTGNFRQDSSFRGRDSRGRGSYQNSTESRRGALDNRARGGFQSGPDSRGGGSFRGERGGSRGGFNRDIRGGSVIQGKSEFGRGGRGGSFGHESRGGGSFGHDTRGGGSFGRDSRGGPSFGHDSRTGGSFGHEFRGGGSFGHETRGGGRSFGSNQFGNRSATGETIKVLATYENEHAKNGSKPTGAAADGKSTSTTGDAKQAAKVGILGKSHIEGKSGGASDGKSQTPSSKSDTPVSTNIKTESTTGTKPTTSSTLVASSKSTVSTSSSSSAAVTSAGDASSTKVSAKVEGKPKEEVTLPNPTLPPGVPDLALGCSDVPGKSAEKLTRLAELLEPLHCKLCAMPLKIRSQADQHYLGKNHAKKVRLYFAVRAAASDDEADRPEGDDKKTETADTKEVSAEVYCKVCDVSFTSVRQSIQHYGGKNHQKKAKTSPGDSTAVPSATTTPATEDASGDAKPTIFECELCCVQVTSQDQYNMHMNGVKHKTRVRNQERMQRQEQRMQEQIRGRGRGRGFRDGRGGRGAFRDNFHDNFMAEPFMRDEFPADFRGGFRGGRGGRGLKRQFGRGMPGMPPPFMMGGPPSLMGDDFYAPPFNKRPSDRRERSNVDELDWAPLNVFHTANGSAGADSRDPWNQRKQQTLGRENSLHHTK